MFKKDYFEKGTEVVVKFSPKDFPFSVGDVVSVVGESISGLIFVTDGTLSSYCNLDHLRLKDEKKDPVVQSVIDKFDQRSTVGIKKYGTTLEENNSDDFLNHLQEELMDAVLYLEKIKRIRYEESS